MQCRVMFHVLMAPVAPSLEDVVSSEVAQANPHRLGKLWAEDVFSCFLSRGKTLAV